MKLKVFSSLGFSFFSFVCGILILIIYLTKHKHRNKNIETILFVILMISNILGCIIDFLHVYTLDTGSPYFWSQLCARVHEFFLVARYYIIMAYVSSLTFSYNSTKKSTKKIIYIIIAVLAVINLGLTLYFPLELITDGYLYDYNSNETTYLLAIPFILCTIFISGLFFSKSVRKNELIPLLYAIILIFVLSLSQVLLNLDMNYQNFLLMIISIAFLFTTENQDVKYVERIESENKELEIISKKQTEFTNNISSSIKDPLNNIIIMSNLLINKQDLSSEEFIKEMDYISKSVEELETTLNKINEVSNLKGDDNI